MNYATPVTEVTLGTGLAVGAYNVATGSPTGLGVLMYGLVFLVALGAAVHGLFVGVEAAVTAGRSPAPAPADTGRGTGADRPRPSDGAAGE